MKFVLAAKSFVPLIVKSSWEAPPIPPSRPPNPPAACVSVDELEELLLVETFSIPELADA